ncbi:Glutathione S-transferase 4 [Nymphaea thermarum]|nr:Glutathione S-transferase 4 [Nymphaea thermarum]
MVEERNPLPPPPPLPMLLGNDSMGTVAVLPTAADIQSAVASTASLAGFMTPVYVGLCRINGIDFEEVKVNLAKGEHRRPEFKDINPMKQVPAIVDGKPKLFESHAILRYLSCAHPRIPDHWYPADLSKRAKIDSVLDWHHSNLRRGAAGLVFNSVLAPALGYPLNLEAAADAEKILIYSLSKIESVWLCGNEKFLVDGLQPSIADLILVCEIMQLEIKLLHIFHDILDNRENSNETENLDSECLEWGKSLFNELLSCMHDMWTPVVASGAFSSL